jgi:hypothetical protein
MAVAGLPRHERRTRNLSGNRHPRPGSFRVVDASERGSPCRSAHSRSRGRICCRPSTKSPRRRTARRGKQIHPPPSWRDARLQTALPLLREPGRRELHRLPVLHEGASAADGLSVLHGADPGDLDCLQFLHQAAQHPLPTLRRGGRTGPRRLREVSVGRPIPVPRVRCGGRPGLEAVRPVRYQAQGVLEVEGTVAVSSRATLRFK